MSEPAKITGIAKQAFIGGLVSIILSPIGVILAFYLGSQLDKPQTNIKYIEPKIYFNEKGTYNVPEDIIRPLKGNLQLLQVIEMIDDYEGASDIIRDNEFDEFDAEEVVITLKQTIETLEFEQQKLSDIIETIVEWSPSEPLNIEPINLGAITGGESIENLVRENKNNALSILRNYRRASGKRSGEITPVINSLESYLTGDFKKERTGKVDFEIGLLNTGGEDDVIFPTGKLSFNGMDIKIKNSKHPGFEVLNPHSFVVIRYEIDLVDNTKKSLEEWKAIVKKSIPQKFAIKVSTGEGESRFESTLSSK